MITHHSLACVLWIALGGFFYILGTLFYLWKSLPYNHVLWHVMAIIGAVSHYYAIAQYVLPDAA